MGNRLRERLAEYGAIVVAGFLAAVVVLYGFAWLADQVLDQQTQALDNATIAFLHQFSSPQLTTAAQLVSLFGAEVIWVIAAVLLAWFAWHRRWSNAITLALVVGGAQVLNDILKATFHRTRPEPVVGLIAAQSFSFPSGHAMVSAAFYFYLAYLTWRYVHGVWRGLFIVGLVLLVLLIGLSRLYLEVHYLSDVIAGYLAGFLWSDTVILANQALTVRRRLRTEARSPQPTSTT
jgi:membrane-associated phospholipid phosphatase